MPAWSERRVVSLAASIALFAAGLFAPGAWTAASSTQPAFRVPLPHVLTVADSLYNLRKRPEAKRYLDSLVAQIRASKDERLLRQALYVRGRQAFGSGEARSAEPDLREALALSRAADDTLLIGHTMRWLGPSLEYLAHPREASAIYDSLRVFARRTRDRYFEAIGVWGHTTEALRTGNVERARRDFETCIPVFQELGATNDEMYALLGFEALQWERLSDYDGARRTLQRLLALSRETGFKEVEAGSLNNLAEIENALGDPGDAVRYWRASRLCYGQDASGRTYPMNGLARAYERLGQLDDAAALFDSIVHLARANGLLQVMSGGLLGIVDVRAKQGRTLEAIQVCRDVLAMGDSLPGKSVLQAALELARLEPPSEAGLRALRDRAQHLERQLGQASVRDLRVEESRYLMRLGHYAEALWGWRALGPDLTPLIQMAACERELGHPDSALVALHRAGRLWERSRTQPRDPEWREARGALAREFLSELVDLTLASGELSRDARTRAAFDVAQQFKSRTYLERMAGPSSAALAALKPDSILSAARLQRDVLQDGELFLDAVVGDRVSFLFAVTRDSLRMARLPAAAVLDERIRLYRDLIATTPTDGVDRSLLVSQRAAASVSQLVLADFQDLLRSTRRLILSLDGSLHLLSFAELPIPGGPGGEVLAERREIARIPSGAVLAAIRRRGAEKQRTSKLLVFATSRTPNEIELPGVEREARALTSRYANVRLHLNEALGAAPQVELPHYDLLHFASHTNIDDQRPWNSGFPLQADAPSDVPTRLRASEILAMRLQARLCVLSGCESAAGKTLTGEGVQSLAGAFLCAGVPTVVATVWPVDDATTERLMRRFYRGLERGQAAGGALREAQDAMRSDSRTRAPFYWAGFVLVGEPETRVVLERRRSIAALPHSWLMGGMAALLLCACALSLWREKRFRSSAARPSPWIARTRWGSVTGLVLLAFWLVLDHTRMTSPALTLRAGSRRPTAEIELGVTAASRGVLRLEWDPVSDADSYAVRLFTPELTPLGRPRVVGEPRLVLAAADPRLASVPDTLLVRVVALRQTSTLATSRLLPFWIQ